MFLKCLELYGFKTFADKVRIDFAEGITALLGPNGCGKSNVVDGVKWVLGEQSLKNLRAEKSEDLIFAGTDSRPSMNVAEVTLTICNEEGLLKLESDEIQIKRRLFRSGENEYYINNTQVRLRDVRELFWDTGVGKIAYSIMEQGKIDQILSSRPEDRRYLFEEAAQITRVKNKMAEGDRKIAQIAENLEKVDVQLAEVTRRADTLREQAGKTKSYRDLKDEIFALERDIFLLRLKNYVRDRDRMSTDVESLAEKRDTLLKEIDAINDAIKESMDNVNDLQKALVVLQQEVIGLARSKNDKAEQAKQLVTRKSESKEQLRNLENKKTALEEKVAQFQEDIGEKDAELFAKRRSLEEDKKNIASFETNIKIAESQITENDYRAVTIENNIKDLDTARGNLRDELDGLTANIVTELDRRLKDAGYSTAHVTRARENVGLLLAKLKSLTAGRKSLSDDLSSALAAGNASPENLKNYADKIRAAFGEAAEVTGQLEAAIDEYTKLAPAFIDEFLSPEGIITKKRALDAEVQRNLKKVTELRERMEGLHGDNAALSTQTDEYRETLGKLKVSKAQREAQITGAEENVRLLRRELAAQENLLRENAQDIETETRRLESVLDAALELEGEIASIERQGEKMMMQQEEMEREISEKSRGLTGTQDSLGDKKAQAGKYQQQLERYNLDINTAESNIAHVKESFQDSYSLDLLQFEERMSTISAAPQDLRDEAAAKKQSLKDLGPVNLMAVEEYQGEEDRRVLLSEQKADVVKALEHLERVKAEEQAEATERFLETYNKIKRNFHNMFRRLFGGGQAQLQLADGTNVLQSGIEIFAQPPGKKLENISLLSGGEKTMTAVALLFATYMVHPSPFCLLDEIDAALDEANVGRFVAILNEFSGVSQYFVITHNRRTAAGSRTLIGITMTESGVSTKLDVRLGERGDPDFVAADITSLEDEDVPPEEGIVVPPHPPRRQQGAKSAAVSEAVSEAQREEAPNAAL